LLNIYHVIIVNPARHPAVNVQGARRFAEFLVSPSTQALIGEFGVEQYGQALFVPDAAKTDDQLGVP
jgi:tungstate transport system substrate-binding protein